MNKKLKGKRPRIYPRSQHPISRKLIDSDALKIMYRLMRHGYKAYLVGGGVRDLLLGCKPKDFDIGTDARPRQIRALFRNSRIIGRRFKLVHIYFRNNKIIEVATFRDKGEHFEDDWQENGKSTRTNENVYGTDETDAFRRDLTINALFYDLSTFSIVDFVGGMKDLKNGVIRIIGDPEERFHEDPVRLMRTVRHSARTGFRIERNTKAALIDNCELIAEASAVRLYEELKKDLVSGYALQTLRDLYKYGLLELIAPEICEDNGLLLDEESGFAAALSRADAMAKKGTELSTTAILSCLCLFIGDPERGLTDLPGRFRYNEEIDRHVYDCFYHLSVPRKTKENICKILKAWNDLVHTPPHKIKSSRWSSKPFLADLICLFQLIAVVNEDYEIIKVLKHAARHRKRTEKARNKARGRKGPRKRRR